MRVDDLDAPSRDFVACAPLHVASRRAKWVFPVNACTSDSLATSVFTVLAAPLPTSVDGSDLGLHAVSSEFPISIRNDSLPLPTPAATPASSTAALHKAALGAISPALRPQRLRRAPNGFRSSGAICCILFSLACRRDQPQTNSDCARDSASAAFTFSDGPAVPSSVGAHFVSRSPLPSRRCWQTSGHRGLWFRSIESYSACRPTTSLHNAKTAPASERLAFPGCTRALHRPSSYCADPTQLPTRPHLLRLNLIPSLQRYLGVSAPQPSSPRRHQRHKTSSSSLSSGSHTPIGRVYNALNRFVTLSSPRRHQRHKTSSSSLSSGSHTPIGRVNNALNRFVTPPSDTFFSDVPRSSPTISFFTWRLANAPHCRKCVL